MIATLAIFILISYLILIGLFTYGFDKAKDFTLQDLPAKTKFSIVIPFRNEAKNLPKLLESISRLNYPNSMFEVILVDDDSEDDSVEIIEKFIDTSVKNRNTQNKNIRVIKNHIITNSAKKDAIAAAVKVSKNSWIITTDADCILPKYWLDTFDECIQTQNTNCIVAPVTYHGKTSFFNRFQILDFLSLQGATIGGFGLKKPFLCNGANFAYRKSMFLSVGGFEGNTNIASGDDIFLLEKFIKSDAEKVMYLKSKKAIVTTKPSANLPDLVQQRLRWASKTSNYNNGFAKLVGLIVLLANFVFLALVPLVLFNLLSSKTAIALFVIKFSIDLLLLFKTTRFFRQETFLLSYLLSSIIYPFFNVSIALLSFFRSYHWKGRTSKK